MSVFKAREWWSTQCGDSGAEELGPGCMAVGNLDNVEGGSAKIAIGCFSGVLRVYRPSQREFRAEDLMLEQQLGAPILQIEVGIFSSHSQKEVQLAVLHPKRLCVYGMRAVSAGDEKSGGGFYQLSLLYKHNLTRSTFNFTFGPFGRADGKDYIAVQSLDGELTVIEQENIAFSKFLPNFLVPGPLCYAPHPVDGFITVNSQFECQCFRYNVLTSSSSGMLASAEDKDKESKRAKAEWTLSIGESAYEICVARHTSILQGTAFDIIVLGEHTIFWLDKAGVLKAQKRLDYIPTSMRPYPVASQSLTTGPTDNLIVSTSVGSMMVYNHDMHLVWAAQLPTTAVAVEICTVGKMRGLVASVGDAGSLSLCYMGTDPPQQVVSTSEKNELNYDAMDEEHRRLLSVIREATSERRTEPTDQLVIRAQVPSVLDDRHGADRGWTNVRLTVKLFLSYTSSQSLDKVTVTVTVPHPFTVCEPTTVVSGVGGGSTPRTISIVFSLSSKDLPTDTTATIAALYHTKTGEPRTSSTHINLPLTMLGKAVAPVKNGEHKLTLDTNRNAPLLTALFEDILPHDDPAAQANVLSFMCHNGDDVTILVSKNSGRYRVQSGGFEALWVLGHELAKRLTTHFSASEGGEPFEISVTEDLPIAEYFAIVDQHFTARQALAAVHKHLADRAQQFRATQKRLIVRFKDRNPAPLDELDALLTKTYENLIDMAEQGEKIEEELRVASCRLGTATQLFLMLIRYRFGLGDEMFELLRSHWSFEVRDGLQHGWEEQTELALTYLLKTVLTKSGKDASAVLPHGPITPATDVNKLKKNMSLVLDRLAAKR